MTHTRVHTRRLRTHTYDTEPNTSPACPLQRSYQHNAKAHNASSREHQPSNLFVLATPTSPLPLPLRDRPGSVRLRAQVAKRGLLAGQETIVGAKACFLQACFAYYADPSTAPSRRLRRPVTVTLVPARRRPLARQVPHTAWGIGVAPPACRRHDAVKIWRYSSSSKTLVLTLDPRVQPARVEIT